MHRRTFLSSLLAAPLALGANHQGTHLIWRRPAPAASVLRHGPKGADQAPKAPFTFVEENHGGTNPKMLVRDAAGSKWLAKWAKEVNAETFASRLAASAGYFVRTAHYMPHGVIEGCEDLKRAKDSIQPDGRFESAVFKLIDKNEPYMAGANWAWVRNPFLESDDDRTKLNGLKIMLMLTSNWDAKDMRDVDAGPNTAIYEVQTPSGVEYRYAFDDWGGSMGSWGGVLSRSKWDAKSYAEQSEALVKGVDKDGFVEWGFEGKNGDDVKSGIRPSDVAWLLMQLQPLQDADIEAGLQAAGATEEDGKTFTNALRTRIQSLEKVAA